MFEKIIAYFGSRSELARRLDVAPAAVTQWGVDGIPPARAIEIEQITGGDFKAVDIVGVKADA